MALSNLGLIQMGGAMLRPGGSLGDGFLAYGHGLQGDAHMQAQQARTDAVQQQMRLLMEKSQQERMAAQQQADAERQFDLIASGQSAPLQAPTPAPVASQGGLNGPLGSGTFGIDRLGLMAEKQLQTPAQASTSPQGDRESAMRALLLAGLKARKSLPEIEAIANARNLGRDEVARVIEGQDDLGRPVQFRESKFGDRIGSGVAKPYEKQFKDTGGSIQSVDPFTAGFVGTRMDKTNSPDSLLSAQTTMRGQNMTDARARELAQIQRETNTTNKELTQSTKHWEKVSDLRKEFAGLPEVKHYKEVIPAQKSATDAIQRDTAQADINLVYATAKIFDPTSVVREGEYATVNNSAPPAERYQGLLNHLTGGGKLTPATRAALLREINSRAQAAQGSYTAAREAFTGIAKRNGFAPDDVFADLPELAGKKADKEPFKMPTAAEIDAAIARKQGR